MTAPATARTRLSALASALPEWASGLVTGGLAAAVTLVAVIAPALAAVAAAPAATGASSVEWAGGAAIASKLWLLAHGVPLETGMATFTLMPLGLSLVCVTVLVATAQRFLDRSWIAVGLAVAAYAFVVGSVATLVWVGSDQASALVARAVLGAVVLAVPGVVIGRVRAHGLTIDALELVPAPLRVGTRIATAAVALALGVASLVAIAWTFVGRQTIAETATGLGVDGVGGVVLALAETTYAPTLAVWALAWLTGLGFQVGDDTLWAPSELLTGALPEVPLLGALPTAAGGRLVWVPLLLVAVGVVARGAMQRRIPAWRADAAVLVTELVVTALLVAGLSSLASGAIGPGRLAVTGPDPWAVGVAAALLIGGGHLLVLVGAAIVRAVAPPPVKPRSSATLRQGAAPRSGTHATGGQPAVKRTDAGAPEPAQSDEGSPGPLERGRSRSAERSAEIRAERSAEHRVGRADDSAREAPAETAGTAARAAERFRRDGAD